MIEEQSHYVCEKPDEIKESYGLDEMFDSYEKAIQEFSKKNIGYTGYATILEFNAKKSKSNGVIKTSIWFETKLPEPSYIKFNWEVK